VGRKTRVADESKEESGGEKWLVSQRYKKLINKLK
jgi:hypothetical protein